MITSGKNDRELVYDKKFGRVRCLSATINTDLLAFYLSSLGEAIHNEEKSIELILKSVGSQIFFSEPRGLLAPLTNSLKIRLLERFVIHGSATKPTPQNTSQEAASVADSIERLTRRLELPGDSKMIRNASSKQILGHKVPNIRPVSIAIERRDQFFLIDGVDLNSMTPSVAIRKTNDVVHTFWQYGRLRSQELLRQNLSRVGVLFNGVPQKTASYIETHDFALDLMSKEADFMIDASGIEGEKELSHLLKD